MMTHLFLSRFSLAAVALALACSGPVESPAVAPVRGITVSTHRGNAEWEREEIGATFAEIEQLGANWVAIHPYARIASDGQVRFRKTETGTAPGYLERPIHHAKQQGLKILIKPHLAYWGSPFDWRGEIEFDQEAEWQRFFSSYRDWIEWLAEASRGADGFVIGTELDRTVHRPEWSELIDRLRQVTDAPLTYAANWTDYRAPRFWTLLDYIGVQGYFPISKADRPEQKDLAAGWRKLVRELARFARQQGKDIVFTELGYNQSWQAAARPWEARTDGPEAEALQVACLAAALTAIEKEPAIRGAFLWKWFPHPRPVGRNFQLATPAMQGVIRDHWGKATRAVVGRGPAGLETGEK